jgi:WD40 repeat protein
MASAHGDNTVRIWDTQTREERKPLDHHSAPVMGVDIIPDGRYLASCSRDSTVIVYDLHPNAPASRKKGSPR